MTHGVDVRPRFEDLAMDDAFRIHGQRRRLHRLGIEVEFVEIARLDQLRRARARQEVPVWIFGMAHADMAERVEHAFMRDHAVGNRELVADVGKRHGHGTFLIGKVMVGGAEKRMPAAGARGGRYPPPCGEGRSPSEAQASGVGVAVEIEARATTKLRPPPRLPTRCALREPTLPTRGRVKPAARVTPR